jgi:hypothetical protein
VSSPALVIAHRARPARSRSPRVAVTAVFVAHGLLFASWTAHIPHVIRSLTRGRRPTRRLPPVTVRLSGNRLLRRFRAALASLPLALGLLPFLTAFVAAGTLLSRALRDAPQGPAAPARSEGTP